MDADDVSRRLAALLDVLAADGFVGLREAISQREREDADEVLVHAVVLLSSLRTAGILREADDEAEPEVGDEELPPGDAELPADPFDDDESAYSTALERARQLREALADQPDLSALLRAFTALSEDECVEVVFELALNALWMRRHGREDAGDR